MAKIERLREAVSGPPAPEYWEQRAKAGWRPVAVEWARDVEGDEGRRLEEEPPFGLHVAADCTHLEEDAAEKQALVLMMELIVQDWPLSKVAAELNERGLRTRRGKRWGPQAVFEMLPRLIEVGPRIFSSQEWVERRPHLFKAV